MRLGYVSLLLRDVYVWRLTVNAAIFVGNYLCRTSVSCAFVWTIISFKSWKHPEGIYSRKRQKVAKKIWSPLRIGFRGNWHLGSSHLSDLISHGINWSKGVTHEYRNSPCRLLALRLSYNLWRSMNLQRLDIDMMRILYRSYEFCRMQAQLLVADNVHRYR